MKRKKREEDMNSFFEQGDLVNRPFECFYFNSQEKPFPVRPHYHYYLEIILMLEGRASMHSNGRPYTVETGEMIVIHPNAVHSIYSADEKPVNYAVFKLDVSRIDMTTKYSPKTRSIFKKLEQDRTDIVIPADETRAMGSHRIFEWCIQEVNERRYGYDQVIRSLIALLMTGILRYYLKNGFVLDSKTFALDSRYDIFCITEYILDEIGSGIKVEDVAAKCNMSYSGFARKFKEIYGMTCKEYMEEARLGKVEELLNYTDFDLNYIAQECGYSDCSHLINSFRKNRGITPAKYRDRSKTKG